ncbi:MAG TPA: DNA repair protein RecO [Legionella sp.]|nr:DNA repair protein RecO [Legionella sp.]
MITEGLDAWVLHKRESGETYVQVTLFTREKGLVRAGYRGGRTPKKQGSLHVFTPLWLTLDVRRDWHYVHQLEAISPSLVLTGDGLFAGLYVNELLYHALTPLDRLPDFYDAYVHTLRALTAATERMVIEVVLRRFEWRLLMVCGYQMSLTHDAQSGAPIQASDHYAFIAGKGFVLASDGFQGAHIMAWACDSLNDIAVLKTVKSIMRRAIDHALDGKPIQARKLYRSIAG